MHLHIKFNFKVIFNYTSEKFYSLFNSFKAMSFWLKFRNKHTLFSIQIHQNLLQAWVKLSSMMIWTHQSNIQLQNRRKKLCSFRVYAEFSIILSI